MAEGRHCASTIRSRSPMDLLDPNDDCLHEIFSPKVLDIKKLCPVEECCPQLFTRYTVVDMNLERRKVFRNFGFSIKDLEIAPCQGWNEYVDETLELMIEYCYRTLESLKLVHCRIHYHDAMRLEKIFSRLETIHFRCCYIDVDDDTLFSNCASLVELKITACRYNCENKSLIFENQFPKLECFQYIGKYDEQYNLESFISNHKNLKELCVANVRNVSTSEGVSTSLLPIIANNCEALEKLEIQITPTENSTEFVRHLKTLLPLRNLKQLKIGCYNANITDFVTELSKLTSLRVLELSMNQGNSALILALSQLTNIKALHLISLKGLGDLNPIASMEQLNELWITTLYEVTNFAIFEMVERLKNLKELVVGNSRPRIDKNDYVNIADVVRKRPYGFPSFLKLGVRSNIFKQLKDDVRHIRNVKLYALNRSAIYGKLLASLCQCERYYS